MHFRCRGVTRGPLVEDRLQAGDVLEVGFFARNIEAEEVLVAVDLGFAGVGEDDEFVAEVAADRAGVGTHRNGAKTHARKRAQVGREHAVIGVFCPLAIEIEGIGVLHQELARTHGAETRTDLVAELQLDMVEVERQVTIGLHVGPEDVRDHFLVRRAVKHRTVLAILDAQHLLAIGIVATAFLPELCGLQSRHQEFDRA
ncbi:hypothetical protein D9M72_294360 [compost metagenome]